MVKRRSLNPNSLPAKPSQVEIRQALVDLWYLVGEEPSSVGADYTTTGNIALEILVCTNTSSITVTLHEKPSDGDEVIIKRQNAEVVIEGNGNTIDGEPSLTLKTRYDSPHLIYTDSGAEWSIV